MTWGKEEVGVAGEGVREEGGRYTGEFVQGMRHGHGCVLAIFFITLEPRVE